jgi:hypothetical protein
VGGVVPGANVFFSHADSSTSNDQINCVLTITGGNYAVNTLTGMGDLTITLGAGALPGGDGCFFISDNASLKLAFVLNNSGVGVSIIATSASLQLTGFTPLPLVITDQTINQMVMTGTGTFTLSDQRTHVNDNLASEMGQETRETEGRQHSQRPLPRD